MAPDAWWVGRQSRNVTSRAGQPTIPGEEGCGVHYMGGAGWGDSDHSCPDVYQHHEHERRRAHDEHGGPRWQRRSSAHHLRNLAGMVLAGPGAGMLLVA